METPIKKEVKAEAKQKKAVKKEEPVEVVEVTPEPVAKTPTYTLSQEDIDEGWNLTEKWKPSGCAEIINFNLYVSLMPLTAYKSFTRVCPAWQPVSLPSFPAF